MSATNNIYGSPGGSDNSASTAAPGKKRSGRGFVLLIIAAVLVALIVIASGNIFVVTEPDEYMVVQQFGKIVSVTTQPGLSYKLPFVQNAYPIPKSIQLYDLPISDVITKDKKTMVADSFVLWKITDPTKFIQNMDGNVAKSETRIGNIVYNSMNNVISSLSQSDIISGRDQLAKHIFDNIGHSLDEYGIELVAIETKHLDLPDDNKHAVYERMISERNNIAASYQAEGDSEATKIRNETDKTISIELSKAGAEAERTIAEGEAEYMRILAEAYNSPERSEFYSFVRSLDAAKASLKGSNKTLILSKDSPIARIFYDLNP